MNTYLQDEHLEFLKEIPDNELNALAEILEYKGNNIPKWKAIATEIQAYGGDTIANTVRGHGVLYKEILQDACGQLKIAKADDVYEMENNLLIYVLNDYLKDKTALEIIELAKNINLEDKDKVNAVLTAIATKKFSLSMFSTKLIQYIIYKSILYMTVKRAVGQSLFKRILINIGVRQVATRQVAAWAGPVGWAIGALTMIPVVSGPAYRITIPACIHVACLRRKHFDALLDNDCNIHAERR